MSYKLFNAMLLLSICSLPLTVSAANCSQKIGCDKKSCEIQNKIDNADLNGHSKKVNGLKDALEHVTKYCTNDDLIAELSEKIDESKHKLEEYKAKLSEANDYNELDKTQKYQKKLEEEKSELIQYEDELSAMQ